jgi:guanylate kinase
VFEKIGLRITPFGKRDTLAVSLFFLLLPYFQYKIFKTGGRKMSLRKIAIGVDWDDVLCDLNTRAIELANRDMGLGLELKDITSWENTGKASVIKRYYMEPELYERQYVTEEAKVFLKALQNEGEVFIITAVAPEFMGIRVRQIKVAFPDFPNENIIMGSQKHLVHFDITLDDANHNIFKSNSNFPVLFRKPWNQDATGVLSVNSYDDFLQLIHQIKRSMMESVHKLEHPAIIALVGPSGSGKHRIMEKLLSYPQFAHPISYTTNPNNRKRHRYISAEDFAAADFLETTMYGGFGYGTAKQDVTDLLDQGLSVVMPLDICGAITMKRQFPTLMVYCKESKDKLIENILRKTCELEEKKLRLLALEPERKHEQLCDLTIRPDEIQKILEIFV